VKRFQHAVMALIFAILLLAGISLLSGCQTPAAVQRPQVPCEPLPVCFIPPGANSTQLETALWGCVLEYRALYSHCAHRVVAK